MSDAEPVVGQDTEDNKQTPKRGRPLKFQSVLEMQAMIDKYFADCDPHMEEVTEWVEARDTKGQLKKDAHGLNYLVEVKHKIMTQQKPYTITGLALALDTSRETLLEYENEVEGRERPAEFVDTIKKAKLKCQHYTELSLEKGNPVGAIFSLKNNYGWIDRTVEDGTQEVIVTTRKHANANSDA